MCFKQIFSSAEKPYIEEVLSRLKISKFFIPKILSRANCIILPESIAVKNIYESSTDPNNTLLIDNEVSTFVLQPYNGIYIPSFNGNEKDSELLRLGQFLLKLHESTNLKESLYESGYNLGDMVKNAIA